MKIIHYILIPIKSKNYIPQQLHDTLLAYKKLNRQYTASFLMSAHLFVIADYPKNNSKSVSNLQLPTLVIFLLKHSRMSNLNSQPVLH